MRRRTLARVSVITAAVLAACVQTVQGEFPVARVAPAKVLTPEEAQARAAALVRAKDERSEADQAEDNGRKSLTR